MSVTIVLIRIVLSAFYGGLIGAEREIHGCAAGLRTHILVCMGSTLFMLISITSAVNYGHVGGVDPSRIAAGVVTGVGFLGAGAIIRYGASVRGLTTAASIWAVSAIGLAVGGGMYVAAVITTAVAVAVLILSRLEERIEGIKRGKSLVVLIDSKEGPGTDEIRRVVANYGGTIKRIMREEKTGEKMIKICFDLVLAKDCRGKIVAEIASMQGVEEVSWV